MRRVIVSELMTLDGVIEAPGHEEHRDGRNAWSLQLTSDDMVKYSIDRVFEVGACLLGRVTYQMWAAFWPTAPKSALADRMNALPKYVVSRTLQEALWNNSTLITGDVMAEISTLKQAPGGDILVAGSADLVDSLMKHDLIDEYQLMVHPIVLGSGKRLFRDESDTAHLQLVDSTTFESGVVLLRYQPTGDASSKQVLR